MKPTFFGDSHDMAKRQIMQWLAPNEVWMAHPMWYDQRPAPPWACPFLPRYARVLNVDIIAGESRDRREFLAATQACTDHLLLDPDTGLRIPNGLPRTHVTINEFIQIVNFPNRQYKITLVYDQSYRTGADLQAGIANKLQLLHNKGAHAVAYIAHKGGRSVVFIWASQDPHVITQATKRMQRGSYFPVCRFVDDGCGHIAGIFPVE